MARKSMKSRVPADVWKALDSMKLGGYDLVTQIGHGAQGRVYAVDAAPEWVIKEWKKQAEIAAYWYTHAAGWKYWRAKQVAKDIAKGILYGPHMPRIVYASNRFVVSEYLEESYEGDDFAVMEARGRPQRQLDKELHSLRRAIRRMTQAGYCVDDVRECNIMRRADGTIVLNDVVA